MKNIAGAIVFGVSLITLTWMALTLLKMGMSTKELTEEARKRLAGLGMVLLYGAILTIVLGIAAGIKWGAGDWGLIL